MPIRRNISRRNSVGLWEVGLFFARTGFVNGRIPPKLLFPVFPVGFIYSVSDERETVRKDENAWRLVTWADRVGPQRLPCVHVKASDCTTTKLRIHREESVAIRQRNYPRYHPLGVVRIFPDCFRRACIPQSHWIPARRKPIPTNPGPNPTCPAAVGRKDQLFASGECEVADSSSSIALMSFCGPFPHPLIDVTYRLFGLSLSLLCCSRLQLGPLASCGYVWTQSVLPFNA